MSLLSYIQSKPILKRIIEGTFWSFLGTAISRVFSLVTNICIARIIGKDEYGAYGIIGTTLEMFSLFGGLAMGFTMIKYCAEYRTKDPLKAGRLLSLTRSTSYLSAGCMALILFFSSDWLAQSVLNRSDLGNLLKVGAAYMFIRTVNNIQLGALAGFDAFKETAKVNTITGLLTPIITLPMVYLYDLKGAVISLILIAVLSYGLCSVMLRRECDRYGIVLNITDLSVYKEWPVLWRFSIPALISFSLLIPVTWFTDALLVNQPDGYSQMGIFSAANQWRQLVIFIPMVMSAVMMSIFSDTYANGKGQQYKEAYNVNMKMTWMIALPATILIITFSAYLNMLFGEKFANAIILIPPLMVTAFFTIINTVTSNAVTSTGRMWTETMFNFSWAGVLILTSILLVPRYGAMGLALANLFAYFVQILARIIFIEKVLIPDSIKEQKSLILFTILTLPAVLFLSLQQNLTVYWGVMLALVSSTPMILKAREILCKSHT